MIQAVHDGRWEQNQDWCFWDYPLMELAGKTMGIIGYGRIRPEHRQNRLALGMNVLALTRTKMRTWKRGDPLCHLDELLTGSDVIALHCPLFRRQKAS